MTLRTHRFQMSRPSSFKLDSSFSTRAAVVARKRVPARCRVVETSFNCADPTKRVLLTLEARVAQGRPEWHPQDPWWPRLQRAGGVLHLDTPLHADVVCAFGLLLSQDRGCLHVSLSLG